MPPRRPPDPPDDVRVNELWEAFKERSSWWLPALGLFGLGYAAIFTAMFFIGALSMWGFPKIFMATNVIVLLGLPMLGVMLWMNRKELFDALSEPEGKPDYTWGQVKENRAEWVDAIVEYRKVHKQFPLDAESLWRIAMIFRDRLKDEDQYLATLQDIVRLPDDAEPAWILTEARDRLLRLDDADPEAGKIVQRATEIELPDEDRQWGRFGPED